MGRLEWMHPSSEIVTVDQSRDIGSVYKGGSSDSGD